MKKSDQLPDDPLAEQIYRYNGRWLKYASKHTGGWRAYDPCCIFCKKPMPVGVRLDYWPDGYSHAVSSGAACTDYDFSGDSASQSYTLEVAGDH